MVRVPGPSIGALDRMADAYTEQMLSAARSVLRTTADMLDARAPQVDDIAPITEAWAKRVDAELIDGIADAYRVGAKPVRDNLLSAGRRALAAAIEDDLNMAIPEISDELAELYLSTARNRLVNVSDEMWFYAREQLLAGMRLGESVQELRARIVNSIEFSDARAEMVARTEVNGASNAGAMDQMRASGMPADKTWIATGGRRTRPTHRDADNQTVELNESFIVGGYPMDRPHDPAGPANEVINCRCSVAFEVREIAFSQRVEQLREAG